jgi:hypothetical protein
MKTQIIAATCLLCTQLPIAIAADAEAGLRVTRYEEVPVSGTGTHFFSTSIEHSRRPTPTGEIVRSTDTVELAGDLTGRVLYHPVSVFDYVAGTLVNTGHQVFSGTVLGVGPVMLYDDSFRFEVDLFTGATVGEVFLTDRLAGRRVQCELTIEGTGNTEAGDATIAYTGTCRMPVDVGEAQLSTVTD